MSHRDKKGAAIKLIIAMALALALAACGGSPEPSSTQEPVSPESEPSAVLSIQLNGVWLAVGESNAPGMMVSFTPGSGFAMDDQGQLVTKPAALGTYEIDGQRMTISTEGSDFCVDGEAWEWQVSRPEDGRLNVVHTVEASPPCGIPAGTEWTLLRVSPSSIDSRALTTTAPAKGASPALRDLTGIWIQAEASAELGLVLAFGRDGSFIIDNHGQIADAPGVVGRLKVKGDTTAFTITGGPACQPGDGWAWRTRLPEEGVLYVKHVKQAQGNCAVRTGTEWTLMRVSPSSPAAKKIIASLEFDG